MIEQIFSEPLQCALVDMHHDDLLGEGRRDSDPVEHGYAQHSAEERSEIRIRLADHRCDVIIYERSRKHRSLYVGND